MTDYFVMGDLSSRIPGKYLVQALDDNKDGQADPEVLAQMQKSVKDDIDGRLGQRYATPFNNPLPAVVRSAAVIFACEMCYARRGVSSKDNPWTTQAGDMRTKLDNVGKGKEDLGVKHKPAEPSGVFVAGNAKTVAKDGKTLA